MKQESQNIIVNGLKYFKLISGIKGDETKNCGLLGEEVDKNFFFLRGNDIDSITINDNGDLIIKRVNGEEYVTNIIQKTSPTFEYDNVNGKILVTYPNGEKQEVDGFYVHERDYRFAIDDTLNGIGSIYDPLRISSLETTGTFAPVDGFIDLTEKDNSLPKDKAPGYRLITKEIIKEENYLYSLNGIEAIQNELNKTNSQWRIATKDDWDELLNAIEHIKDINDNLARNHNYSGDDFKWLGNIAGVGLKSIDYWKEYNENIDEELTDGMNKFELNILPSGFYGKINCDEYNNSISDIINNVGETTVMWCYPTENYGNKPYIKIFQYNKGGVGQYVGTNDNKFSVRLVKDYVKDNYKPFEDILGVSYPTKLIYFTHEGINYAKIWIEVNFNSNIESFGGIHSEKLENEFSGKTVFFINECYANENNENKWRKKALVNGESVVIASYDGLEYSEWRVIDDNLVNTIEGAILNSNSGLTFLNKKIEDEIKTRKRKDEELDTEVSITKNRIVDVENDITVLKQDIETLDVNYDAETKFIRLKLGNGAFSPGFNANQFIVNGILDDIIYENDKLIFIFKTEGEETKRIEVNITDFLDLSPFYDEIENLKTTISTLTNEIKTLKNSIIGTIKDTITTCIKGSDDINVTVNGDKTLKLTFSDDTIFGDEKFI